MAAYSPCRQVGQLQCRPIGLLYSTYSGTVQSIPYLYSTTGVLCLHTIYYSSCQWGSWFMLDVHVEGATPKSKYHQEQRPST